MELDGFFSALSDGFILTDISGNIVYMNKSAIELVSAPKYFKHKPFNEVCKLINVNTGEIFNAPISEAINTQKSLGLKKNIGIRKEKKFIYLSATVSPVKSRGEVVGASVFLRDVTHLRELEINLEKKQSQAEEASRIKGEFLANMSHEIRTPINGFIGMVELTLRSHLTETQRANLLSAKTCANDLLQIINDILDYSKLENNKMEVECLNVDLYELLDGVERVHQKMANQKGLFFIRANRKNLPQFIKGDPLRLRQILNNLLTNAIKFTSNGAISLSARLKERDNKKLLEFAVLDSGIGILRENRKKLFVAFSQVDGSTTRKYGGTGLGLRIVKELASLMGGSVKVSSFPNIGSCFYAYIPYIEGEQKENIKPIERPSPFGNKDISKLLAMCKERLLS